MNTKINGKQASASMSRRSFIAGLGVAGLTLATTSLVGCAGSSTAAMGAASGNTAENFGTIKVGTNPGTGNIFGYIAVDKGFDTEEGYTTDFSDFDNSTDALNALQVGKIDVGVNYGTAAPLTFVTKGADFVIFGGYVSGGMPVYAQQDFEYIGPESFKGKTVGTARMYTPDIIWRGAMKDAGIDLENDLTIVEFKKPSEVLAAVIAGQVDVGVGTNSTYIGAMQAGLKVLCWTNDLDPTAVCCRQVANASWLSESPDRAVAYLKSLIRAEQVLEEDPDFAVASFASHTNIDEDKARELLLETNQELWVDPKSNGVEKMWEELIDLEYIDPGDIDVDDHINIQLYQTALDELKEEHPESSEYLSTLQARYETYNSNLLGA